MKNFLLYSLVIIICFAAGCKKDQQNNKVYLLKQQIIDDRIEGHPLDTTTYTYSDQNRILSITDGTPPNRVSFSYTYDSESRISIGRKYDNNGTLIIEFDFYYNPGSSGYYFHGPTHPADTATFTFNSKKQATEIQSLHSGSQVFTYDVNGNIASSTIFAADGSSNILDQNYATYDNKKNPFSQIPAGNNYLMSIVYQDPSTLINNIVINNADTYAYTYNSDGFPTKALVTTSTGTFPIYYSYIVK